MSLITQGLLFYNIVWGTVFLVVKGPAADPTDAPQP
jgi:hypothetical protein